MFTIFLQQILINRLLLAVIGDKKKKKVILGSVWIHLKTEKYCSKIIFKCVNSTMGPIFNEKIDKK